MFERLEEYTNELMFADHSIDLFLAASSIKLVPYNSPMHRLVDPRLLLGTPGWKNAEIWPASEMPNFPPPQAAAPQAAPQAPPAPRKSAAPPDDLSGVAGAVPVEPKGSLLDDVSLAVQLIHEFRRCLELARYQQSNEGPGSADASRPAAVETS